MSIFRNIYIYNTCQYLYFCRKFAKIHKGKRKPKRNLEFTSSADNKSCKNVFLMQKHVVMNNLSDLLNYLSTGTLTFHWQISRKRSTVFNNYKMNICDQVHLQKFWHTWRTWKMLKKIWIQIYQLWNLYCNTEESFARPKFCNIFKFCMDELLKIATKVKFWKANSREYQNFISFNFTNKLRLPIWIFDVMYYFEW